eukprot:CAMPEP_0114297338 /NCGR_PEP_ID=MMETSP0059-20121206/11802_1 /TAXON_ID=36894 /ORGANISM="Pyramimonas parkeae, Strain CCMP726" /LENGTH=597 /DNA_ID=CAMNT_0001419567 /DNA_START=157 /DNA_END=1947 /DNA_ORIENTATION=+
MASVPNLKNNSRCFDLEMEGAELAFRDLSFEVNLKNGSQKKILSNVSGAIPGGKLCYMMGPSGAGKSSLLDALADRVKAPVSGTVLVDGVPKNPATFNNIAKYVQQEDNLIPILTVQQTFEVMAMFYSTDMKVVKDRSERAIAMLGLEKQRDTIIGGAILRGLSGGQKRRVSIGCELVATPRIMFLDEPTSGLDSAAAWNVVSALKSIASQVGTTLVLTIHQPSETLFRLSDRFLLLSSGRLCFMGDTLQAVKHFKSLDREMPEMTSSADWMLDLVDTSFQDLAAVEDLMKGWEESAGARELLQHILEIERSASERLPARVHAATPFWWQVKALMWRMSLNIMKNPAVVWLRFGMYFALSILISTIWIDVGTVDSSITDILNVIFFISAFMVFMSISVLPAFLEEKAVFVKERANGAYGPVAFSVAHLIVDLPPLFLQALVNGTLCYWCIGLNDGTDRYIFFIVDLFLSFAVAEALCFLIAVLVPSFIVGIALGAFTYGAFMVVQGFFIRVEDIGWWWRWMHYIAMHSYSFSAFLDNEFKGKDFTCPGESRMWTCTDDIVKGEYVLEYYGYDDVDKWANMAVLVAMMLAYRIVATWW